MSPSTLATSRGVFLGSTLTWALALAVPWAASAQELPTVVVLSTGGTIASVYDAERGGFAPASTWPCRPTPRPAAWRS